jgi:hypothetical protein
MRSASQSVFLRPVNSFNVNSNYFMPAKFGGDHAFKFGGYWKNAHSQSVNRTGGNATVRYPNQAAYDNNTCVNLSAGCAVNLTRDGNTVY